MNYSVTDALKTPMFTGTLESCWQYLSMLYGSITVRALYDTGIRITPT